jgi:CheY-like chemotaxis protein
MSSSAPGPVVLLVQCTDDVEMYVEFLAHEGVTPVVVSTAVDALVAAPHAHVVVTGIHLDGEMTGLELVAQLRAHERTRDIPIVVLTASAWHAERDRARDAGCDLFLSKPCLPDDLLRQVRLLIASGRRSTKKRTAKATVPDRADSRARERRKRSHG